MNKWFKNLLLISLVLLGAGWGNKAWAQNASGMSGAVNAAAQQNPKNQPKALQVSQQIAALDKKLALDPTNQTLLDQRKFMLLEYGCYSMGVCNDAVQGGEWIPMFVTGGELDTWNYARLMAMVRHLSQQKDPINYYDDVRNAITSQHQALLASLDQDPNLKAKAEQRAAALLGNDVRVENADDLKCSIFDLQLGNCLLVFVRAANVYVLEPASSLLVGLANEIFDLSFKYSVRDFGTYLKAPTNAPIVAGWTVVRDFVNIVFIFALLYAALSLIVQIRGFNQGVDGKKLVGYIVVGALLVNFSAFFVGIVINLSNSLANQIYCTAADCSKETPDLAINLVRFNNRELYKLHNANNGFEVAIKGAFIGWGTVLFSVITAISLLVAALLMIIRFIQLILVIVFSPILFLGSTFGIFSGLAKKIKDTLLKQAIFAPAFLFMILIITRFVSNNGLFNDNLTTLTSAAIYVVILNGLIISSMLLSNYMGLYGAATLNTYGKKMIGGATVGAAGRLGRATIGRAGKNLTESGSLRDAASQRGARGWIARQTLRAGDTASKLSFDARAVDSVKKLGLGNAQKGGYVGDIKKKAEIADRDAKLLAGKDSAGNEVSARENERVEGVRLEATNNAQKIREQAESAKATAISSAEPQITAKEAELARELDQIRQDANSQLDSGSSNPEDVKAERENKEAQVRDRINGEVEKIKKLRDEEIAKAQKEIDLSEEIKTKTDKIQPRKRIQELADQFDDQEGKEPQSWYRFNRWRGKVTRTRKAQAAAIRKQAKSPQEKYKENLNKLLEQVEKPPEKPTA